LLTDPHHMVIKQFLLLGLAVDLFSVKLAQIMYEYFVFIMFSGSLPAVTLSFDLLTPKSNHYICDDIWEKFPSLIFEI